MATHKIAYCRLSREEQDKGQTMAQQIDLLRQWGFDELYQDTESGRHDDRVNFLRMLARARELAAAGDTVEIRVARDDRWGRSLTLVALVEELEGLGIKIYSRERGQISTATATEWKQTAWEALEAESYSRRLSDNVRRGYQYKRQQRQHLTGKPPWGYQIVDKKYAPDIEHWDSARTAIDMYLGGTSLRQLSRWMFECHGKTWGVSSIRDWMLNPVLRGHTAYTIGGVTNAERRRGVNVGAKPKEVIYNTHPALITEAEYGAILQRAELNKRWGARATGSPHAVTTTYIFCGHCGCRCRSLGGSDRRYFGCKERGCPGYDPPRVRDRVVEAAIQNAILDAAESIAAESLAPTDALDPRVPALEREAEALRPMASRPAIAAEIAAIELEISQLKAAQGHQAAGDAELRERIADLHWVDWATVPAKDRRAIYAAVVTRVEVLGGEVVEVRVRGVG